MSPRVEDSESSTEESESNEGNSSPDLYSPRKEEEDSDQTQTNFQYQELQRPLPIYILQHTFIFFIISKYDCKLLNYCSIWKQVAPRKKTHNTRTYGITSYTQYRDPHKLKNCL
jgi:hypothetical protein